MDAFEEGEEAAENPAFGGEDPATERPVARALAEQKAKEGGGTGAAADAAGEEMVLIPDLFVGWRRFLCKADGGPRFLSGRRRVYLLPCVAHSRCC
eukprot:SAG22_NODE_3844_length_1505_cov_2.236842_2_plen_96_part_00